MALSADGTGAGASTATWWLDGAWVRRARSFDGGPKAECSHVVWLQVGPWFADFRHPFPGRQAAHSLDIAHAFSGTVETVDSADGHATVTWWHDLDTEDTSGVPDTAQVAPTGGQLVETGAGYVEWWSRPDAWGQEWSGLVLEHVGPEASIGPAGESVTARVVSIGAMAVAVWAAPEAGGAYWEGEGGWEPSRQVGEAAVRADVGPALRSGLRAAPLPDGWRIRRAR
jgi:hypothetical protein